MNQAPEGTAGSEVSTSTANPNRGAAHFIYASSLANSKKYDEAIREYQKAIQLEPKALLSYMQLANVYQLQGKSDQMIATYQKALTVAPDNPACGGRIGQRLPDTRAT